MRRVPIERLEIAQLELPPFPLYRFLDIAPRRAFAILFVLSPRLPALRPPREDLTAFRLGILATYRTDGELKAILGILGEDLFTRCLKDRGFRQFDGFFIRAPNGSNWVVDTAHAGRGIPVAFTKRFGPDAPGAGEPHTVVAMAAVEHVELPSRSREELLQRLIQGVQRQWAGARYKLIAFETSEDRSLDADCVRYTFTAEDRAVPGFPGAVFTFSGRGFRCVHPHRLAPLSLPSLVIDVSYSQRFQHGQWIGALEAEVAPFLQSLVFADIEPGPYVIASVGNYASLLRHMKRDSEARDMQAKAEKLREPLEGGSSRYLGFDPSAILREYAALLRTQNREAEASEMEALAVEYVLCSLPA